ncbi:MAG: ketoacyl-ACP synthase III [Bacteroidales bacterium]|nr:ketoacyl-ACP synthase III [Bacteroidales bacterium]
MKIIGTGKMLPSLSVTNNMLATFLDTSDEWIKTRTGINERRLLSDEDLVTLAAQASEEALKDAGLTAKDIDYIICSNVANSFVTPSLSCIVEGKIDAYCPCIDINGACTGFIYALDMAESFLKTKNINNILIVCAEEPSRFTNWKERNTSVLFGDGAAAVVVTKGDDLLSLELNSTSNYEPLYYKLEMEKTPYNRLHEDFQPLVMNGKEVYKLAVSASTADIQTVLREAGLSADDVNYYLLHQANIRIIETIREKLEQPQVKFPHNIEKYGNTSSASIPILLDEMRRSGKIKQGDVLVFSAFGAGFTTGACLFKWNN